MKLNKRFTVIALVLVLALTAGWALPALAQIDCPCTSKVDELCLMYTGSAAATIRVWVDRGGNSFDAYNELVNPGETFCFSGDPGLNPEVDIFVDGVEHTWIHTSCSVDLNPGDVYCGDRGAEPDHGNVPPCFTVVAMKDHDTGALCPSTCDSNSLSGGTISYDQPTKTVSWDITNNSLTDARLMQRLFDTVWPNGNGNLVEVAFGGTTIWTDSVGVPEPANIHSGWSGTVADRTLAAGQTKTLTLTFLTDVNTSPSDSDPYVIWVEFHGTNCVVDTEAGEPTVIVLSSFAANSSTGGSVSPLWLGLMGTVLAAGSLFWVKRRG